MPTKVRPRRANAEAHKNSLPESSTRDHIRAADGVKLRDYQQAIVANALRHLAKPNPENAYIAVGCGGGKTVIATEIARHELARGGRVLFLVDRDVLVEQAARVLSAVTVTGIIKAGRREYDTPITVASRQTLIRGDHLERLLASGQITLIIIDEAHHAHDRNSYGGLLARLPQAAVIGLTGTPFRAGGGFKVMFPVCLASVSLSDLTHKGALVEPSWQPVGLDGVDLSHLKLRGGDFAAEDIARAVQGHAGTIAKAVAPQSWATTCRWRSARPSSTPAN